jgi:undecaprenyl-diphosphatase
MVFFVWLGFQVSGGQTQALDAQVREIVHGWATPRLTYAMLGITLWGAGFLLVPLSLFLIWRLARAKRRRAALLLVIAALGAEAFTEFLKLLYRRPRPESFFDYPEPVTFSFPSGHALVSSCFYGTLAAILTSRMHSGPAKTVIWAAAALVALVIGFSRIYLGVHYFSDVVGGYAAGLAWMGAVRGGLEIWLRRKGRPAPATMDVRTP